MKIITEFSDYAIQSVEYFISAIKTSLSLRDLSGLSNGRIEAINVSKEHPLVVLMGSQISVNPNLEATRTSLLPAISVTPGNLSEEGITLGKAPQTFIINDEWISELKEISNKTLKDIQSETGLITLDQIDAIISEYRKGSGITRCIKHTWGWNEEINISVWSDSPDVDILFGTLLDSILAKITTGFMGDNSPVKNMKYRITKGLTNFNFGRVLFGTEYSLTFYNSYHNYTIYQEDHITEHGGINVTGENSGYKVSGSEEIWRQTII